MPSPSREPLFVRKVLATCRLRRLLSHEDRVLVALSGGPDSTALLAALVALRERGEVASVAALHVDHGLRAGSALDGDFCESLCERLGVPLERRNVLVAPGNVQAQARAARYAALHEAAARLGATRIATGHTRTDQAETVLWRLSRGAGARGLAGIPPRRGALIRPLIDRSRDEVLAFLRDAALPWREDPTNASPRFDRNRLRREVLPLLRSMNPRVEAALARAADLARDDERALVRSARARLATTGAEVGLRALRASTPAIRRRIVRVLWRRARGEARRLPAERVEAILALARRDRPGTVDLAGGLEARVGDGRLSIGPRRPAAPALASRADVVVPAPGRYDVPGRACAVEVLARDASDAVSWPLVVRPRRPGDRFRPSKGRGSKTLKRWLIDRKVPRELRDGLLVIADARGEVLGLPELDAWSAALAPAGAPLLAIRIISTG